jgi:hypothetical protein
VFAFYLEVYALSAGRLIAKKAKDKIRSKQNQNGRPEILCKPKEGCTQ